MRDAAVLGPSLVRSNGVLYWRIEPRSVCPKRVPPNQRNALVEDDERNGEAEQHWVGPRGAALDRRIDAEVHLATFQCEAVQPLELDLRDGRKNKV